MNIDKLIDRYFKGKASNVAIEVFDDAADSQCRQPTEDTFRIYGANV